MPQNVQQIESQNVPCFGEKLKSIHLQPIGVKEIRMVGNKVELRGTVNLSIFQAQKAYACLFHKTETRVYLHTKALYKFLPR